LLLLTTYAPDINRTLLGQVRNQWCGRKRSVLVYRVVAWGEHATYDICSHVKSRYSGQGKALARFW
jgi:hypothetical protein